MVMLGGFFMGVTAHVSLCCRLSMLFNPAGDVAKYPESKEMGGLSGPPLFELSTQV